MNMIYCNNCGVELEKGMPNCPLCGEPATATPPTERLQKDVPSVQQNALFDHRKLDQPRKKFTWEIVSLILLSGAIATFIVDIAINRHFTWSEYPIAICLITFFYLTLFAFWKQSALFNMAGSFVLSSIFLLILDLLKSGLNWPVKFGIPLLFSGNVIVAALLVVIRLSKHKGINLIAYTFLAGALFCLCIESIVSFSKTSVLRLWWSLIVAACVLPVALVLLFVHFRLQKGRSLQKSFHI